MKKDALIERLEKLVMPITDELDYELYHVEFVKEDGENYLRNRQLEMLDLNLEKKLPRICFLFMKF